MSSKKKKKNNNNYLVSIYFTTQYSGIFEFFSRVLNYLRIKNIFPGKCR